MRKIIFSKWATPILLLTVIWMGALAWQSYRERSIIHDKVVELESKISNLEHDNEQLSGSLNYYQSDEYLEKQARMQLNYKMPGEQAVVVYKNDAPEEQIAEVGQRWYERLWGTIINLFQ